MLAWLEGEGIAGTFGTFVDQHLPAPLSQPPIWRCYDAQHPL